jgi:hypothetical protein
MNKKRTKLPVRSSSRKQVQHTRRYDSGKVSLVNRGITKPKSKNHVKYSSKTKKGAIKARDRYEPSSRKDVSSSLRLTPRIRTISKPLAEIPLENKPKLNDFMQTLNGFYATQTYHKFPRIDQIDTPNHTRLINSLEPLFLFTDGVNYLLKNHSDTRMPLIEAIADIVESSPEGINDITIKPKSGDEFEIEAENSDNVYFRRTINIPNSKITDTVDLMYDNRGNRILCLFREH